MHEKRAVQALVLSGIYVNFVAVSFWKWSTEMNRHTLNCYSYRHVLAEARSFDYSFEESVITYKSVSLPFPHFII